MTRKTSIDVYHRIEAEGLLSNRRWEVYKLLYQHGPATSSELFEKYKTEYKPSFRYNMNIHSRLNELKKMGIAEELGERECRVSGNTVILWDVTEKLPKKFERPLSEKQELQLKYNRVRSALKAVWKDKRTPEVIRDLIREKTKKGSQDATV